MCTNLNAFRLKPYACSLAIKSSCDKQSDPSDKCVKRAPKQLPLSTDDFHFPSMAKRQY